MTARALALLLGLGVGCASAPEGPAVSASDGRYAMGTVLEVTVLAGDRAEARAAGEALFGLAGRLDALMTVYDPASDVSRLNAAAGQGPRRVDPEVTRVLERSVALSRLTGGAFDVTVGPLVELWTRAARAGTPPSAAALAATRASVGPEQLRIHADGRVELVSAGARVNLGGIAKGYALDRMRSLLLERGVRDALLNFGQSSTWALGRPQDGPGWRLLVRGPDETLLGVLTLRDQALSVSASLGQSVEIGGRRYGHVIDPRSGQPLVRRRQALVVAPDAALAEALSKALLVLGEREGLALVESAAGCHALLVDAGGGRWRTSGWDGAVDFEALDSEKPVNEVLGNHD